MVDLQKRLALFFKCTIASSLDASDGGFRASNGSGSLLTHSPPSHYPQATVNPITMKAGRPAQDGTMVLDP